MDKQKNEKRYSAQALAIAMLVLVVSSLIALSMFSRSRRDKALTFEERASAEALEVSDVVLNSLVRFEVEDIIEAINNILETGEVFDEDEGIVLTESITEGKEEVTELFQDLGLLEVGVTISELIDPLCPLDLQPNEYKLTFEKADPNTRYPIRPGHVWTFPTWRVIPSILLPDPEEPDPEEPDPEEPEPPPDPVCLLKLRFYETVDPFAGFVFTKIYCEYDETGVIQSCTNYDDAKFYPEESYINTMIEKYAFELNDVINPNFLPVPGNWIPILPVTPGVDESLDIDLNLSSNPPSEVRIKAIGGLASPGIEISYELEGEDCRPGVNMYQLKATANCSGVFRGKEIVIPQKGHNVLFDYVFFSGVE